MFFGCQVYEEGKFAPEQGHTGMWHVWCHTGAMKLLEQKNYERLLTDNPNATFTVNFANGAAARIVPGHPLWQMLAEISKSYTVKVFPLTWKAQYEPWQGRPGDHHQFDAFTIETKKS